MYVVNTCVCVLLNFITNLLNYFIYFTEIVFDQNKNFQLVLDYLEHI